MIGTVLLLALVALYLIALGYLVHIGWRFADR